MPLDSPAPIHPIARELYLVVRYALSIVNWNFKHNFFVQKTFVHVGQYLAAKLAFTAAVAELQSFVFHFDELLGWASEHGIPKLTIKGDIELTWEVSESGLEVVLG